MESTRLVPLPIGEQLHDKWKFVFYLILLAAIMAAAYWLPTSYNVSSGILVGGSCGIIGHYKATRVSRLVIPANLTSRQQMQDYLLSLKYIKPNNSQVYIPGIHRLLRFDAQNIDMALKNDSYHVTGPLYIMKKIQKAVEARS